MQFHKDNAPAHTSSIAMARIHELGVELIPSPHCNVFENSREVIVSKLVRVHLEKCLVETTKFWLVQPQSMVIIRTTKSLVEQTKFFG